MMDWRVSMVAMGLGAVAAIGLYVVVHERKRKAKKEVLRKLETPIGKDMLVEILHEASGEATKFAVQISEWVAKMQQEHALTEERVHQLRQQRFEATLDEVINRIRQKKGVSEKVMDAAFREHVNDKDVQEALSHIRRQIAPTLAGSRSAPQQLAGPPPPLSRDKLKEIMVFNAVQLERELAPIKKQVADARKTTPSAQLNPEVLVELQQSISDAVKSRFSYNDEQVMAAIDQFGVKTDPEFAGVLARITSTLANALQ
mmetsp:Transcript_43919/g.103186  ORF Transcript_43919/g.103186 Transcript_43919/m.103186 type:complete len:258 (+) Transcript_43919:57-830(+)